MMSSPIILIDFSHVSQLMIWHWTWMHIGSNVGFIWDIVKIRHNFSYADCIFSAMTPKWPLTFDWPSVFWPSLLIGICCSNTTFSLSNTGQTYGVSVIFWLTWCNLLPLPPKNEGFWVKLEFRHTYKLCHINICWCTVGNLKHPFW